MTFSNSRSQSFFLFLNWGWVLGYMGIHFMKIICIHKVLWNNVTKHTQIYFWCVKIYFSCFYWKWQNKSFTFLTLSSSSSVTLHEISLSLRALSNFSTSARRASLSSLTCNGSSVVFTSNALPYKGRKYYKSLDWQYQLEPLLES